MLPMVSADLVHIGTATPMFSTSVTSIAPSSLSRVSGSGAHHHGLHYENSPTDTNTTSTSASSSTTRSTSTSTSTSCSSSLIALAPSKFFTTSIHDIYPPALAIAATTSTREIRAATTTYYQAHDPCWIQLPLRLEALQARDHDHHHKLIIYEIHNQHSIPVTCTVPSYTPLACGHCSH
mmetsp:Transcript_5812/g.13834  ORF Transcript_5812/g.13834 Transcript_5812/m.13834 type:complete len:179 (-) Transcript_5812:38-574(-)